MINFTSLTYKNIMSVGNSPITIDLNKAPTTVIGGQNGSGKSTILLAFAYCFFGKFISGIKLAQAINSINKKNLVVEGEFEKHGDKWKVVRGEKPKKFEIYKNGDLLDQYANARDQQKFLEVILGMDYKLFTQVILLNKERYIPFMEMGASDRRKIVEDILGISIFSEMNEVTKTQISEFKRSQANIEKERDVKKAELNGQQNLISQLQQSIETQSAATTEQIKDKKEKLKFKEEQKESLEKELEGLKTEGWDRVKTQLKDFTKLADDFDRQLKDNKKISKFFEDNDTCPTCDQPITEELRAFKVDDAQEKVSEVEKIVSEMMTEVEKVRSQDEYFSDVEQKANQHKSELSNVTYAINNLKTDIESISSKGSNDVDKKKLEEGITTYNDLEDQLESLNERLRSTLEDIESYEDLRSILKDDGVKALIVKEYNAIINKKINEYLASMDFYINMTIDENFKETFHSMGRDTFTYENLSSGQKTRVNIAITLALLEVGSLKNSVVTNILFLDEILEPIDAEGVKDVMTLFKEKLSSKNIFVITQRYDEFENQFQSAIRFKLNSGFTEIM